MGQGQVGIGHSARHLSTSNREDFVHVSLSHGTAKAYLSAVRHWQVKMSQRRPKNGRHATTGADLEGAP